MGVKISIIGAGSAVFSLRLIRDLCRTPGLADSAVSIMDIDAGRLDDVHRLFTRYVREVGSRLRIEKTLDRRQSLRGADFVVNTAMVGGYDHWKEGWRIAQRLGYRFGGSLHVMHDEAFWVNSYQLQLMESIIQDFLDICPDAWLLLVANPVLAGVTFLTRKYRGAKVVGMCHGFEGVFDVARVLALDPEKISFEIPGVNHFVWMNRFAYEGRDAFPLLDRWVEQMSEGYFRTCSPCDSMGPKAIDLYRHFGVFPVGDTGTPGGGSWGYWYHKDKKTERRWNEDPSGWFERYVADGRRTLVDIQSAARDPTIRVADAYPGTSGEPMVPLIEVIACNVERVVIVNIPNSGEFVEGVPADFEVEVPAIVNAKGIAGKKTKRLPEAVLSFLTRDRIAPVELELEAYRSGRRACMIDLLLMDPWTRSGEQAQKLFAEILELPFNGRMRKHFGA